jgi:hypothetical protein
MCEYDHAARPGITTGRTDDSNMVWYPGNSKAVCCTLMTWPVGPEEFWHG